MVDRLQLSEKLLQPHSIAPAVGSFPREETFPPGLRAKCQAKGTAGCAFSPEGVALLFRVVGIGQDIYMASKP